MSDIAPTKHEIKQKLFKHNLDLLYQASKQMLMANIGISIFVIWLYNSTEIHRQTFYWFGTLVAIILIRAYLAHLYLADKDKNKRYDLWFRIYLAGTTLTAFTWGMTTYALMPYASETIIYSTIVIIVGITTAALTSLGYNFLIYFFYILPISMLMSHYLIFVRGTTSDIAMGIGFIPFSLFLMATARNYSRNYNQAIRLQFEREHLVEQLEERIEHQVKLSEELHRLSITDSLTGAPNRHLFEEESEKAFNRFLRYNHGLSILVIDLDHFKNINDRYGHKAGDKVLQVFSQSCKSIVRSTDTFARVGGEEFCFLLEQTSRDHTLEVANRLKAMIANLEILLDNGESIQITISIGCSLVKESDSNIDDAYIRADRALYQAKENGRNRVEIID